MRNLILLVVFLFAAAPAAAHPPVSVVFDSKGNVYYSDLAAVWRVTPEGRKSVVVPGVHTHELYVDPADNLFGEHLWYEGDATKKWGHYVWRRDSSGRIEKIVGPKEGFLTNYSFIRDGTGTMYWAERGDRTTIRKRLANGTIATHAAGEFKNVRWMTATPAGTLYLVDDGAVKKVARDGTTSTLARGLREWNVMELIPFGPSHNIMGIWTDVRENVFLAVHGGGVVKRISPQGKVTIVARSTDPWAPVGGAVAANGDLLILESGPDYKYRLRRIGPKGQQRVY